MPEIQVTYYTGEWSKSDRAEVRAAFAATGFDIREDDGSIKSWQAEIPAQLIVDVMAVMGAGATLVTLVNGLLDLYDRVRRKKSGGGSVQVFAPGRAYIVPLDLDADSAHDAIIAIVKDFADGNTGRRGDMTWRDGRWKTYEEFYGLAPRGRTPTAGHGASHIREVATRVRRGRKGRPGQQR